MSNNINRSSLEKAKTDFEEIRKFAQEQAEKKLQEEVDKKLLKIINEKLNEDVNISVDEEGNVAISKDGEEVASVNASEESSDSESADIESDIDGKNDEVADDEFMVSDEEEPISVSDEELEETFELENNDELNNQTSMQNNNMKMEQDATAAPAPAAPAAPAPDASTAPAPAPDASTAPAPEATTPEEGGSDAAIESLVSKMDTLINLMMQQQGVSQDQTSGQEFEVIDDENAGASAPGAPAAEAGAPAPAAPAAEAPVQEDMEFEITDFEEPSDSVLEIVDDMQDSEDVEIVDEYEESHDGDSMEETRGLGFTSKRTGDKTLKMDKMKAEKGHHAPVTAINEIKAQYESKIDELKKENSGLKSERKEFEEAFVQLREQFDEMQTFNGKLALVNKLLMNGGLSFDEKLKVCEQFDSAETIEEAQKIYKSIIKENNIKVNDVTSKIKSATTHTAKPTTEAKPLYESDEARRMKKLAGLSKNSEE